ncbi:MAG: phosphoribosyl-ATP diphosphatase [Anaerolineae bacterium]
MTSDVIEELSRVIEDRKRHPREGSYTCKLFDAGRAEILKKVGEEAAEVVVAGALESDDRLVYETADLVYHLLVMLAAKGLHWQDIAEELARRFR